MTGRHCAAGAALRRVVCSAPAPPRHLSCLLSLARQNSAEFGYARLKCAELGSNQARIAARFSVLSWFIKTHFLVALIIRL